MIFVFNLIVGTGALTLPSVFSRAGWLLGSLIVVLLAFLSYVTLTFIIEASSCANALVNHRRLKQSPGALTEDETQLHSHTESDAAENYSTDDDQDDDQDHMDTDTVPAETTPLFLGERQRLAGLYSLDDKFELGELAALFFNRLGLVAFYLCMCVYLYGDLSIYNAAVAKSLTDVVCGNGSSSIPSNTTLNYTDYYDAELDPPLECWPGMPRTTFYRLCLVAFVCLLGPFVFFNPAKTKPLQMLTALFRWLAFFVMILLACLRFVHGEADGAPPMGDWVQVPNLFGACIYSFMCHHSLPSLVAPIRQKERLKFALGLDYVWIALFYLLLALTGSFAFRHLQDLYTLNFIPDGASPALKLVEYFLALFPVFTLSASYPIIGITLRNNLQILCRDLSPALDARRQGVLSRALFPLLAIVPPLLITLNTENIHSLVRFTGSYAGAGIQYLIPVALIYVARRRSKSVLGAHLPNRFQSPFRHGFWLVVVMLWTVICVCLVSLTFVWDK